jgi:diguanylate cyclase (GGDEF)-like protein/PAS domain S-box-containing protein
MVDREAFQIYVKNLHLDNRFPGIQGVGFSLIVQPSEKAKHIQTIRNEGFPNYTLRPEGERDLYTAIIYLEPFTGRNLRAFGYDMYSEAVRRKALEQARDLDKATISGKVKLLQETEQHVQAGFLMYVPVYRNDRPYNTLDERRANIVGWVYAPFRMDDLMLGILGEQIQNLDLKIYDGEVTTPEALMNNIESELVPHQIDMAQYQFTQKIEYVGHIWTITLHSLPTFEAKVDTERVTLIRLAGVLTTLLLTMLITLLASGRSRALKLAELMTRELRDSENKLNIILDNVEAYIYIKDSESRYLYANKMTCQLFGQPLEAIIGKTDDAFFDGATATHFRENDRSVFESGKALTTEEIDASSRETYLAIKQPLYSAAGTIYGLCGISTNITQRKQVEQQLIESEHRFRGLFENAPLPYQSLDIEGNILDVNQAWLDLVGCSREDVIGQFFGDLMKESSQSIVLAAFSKFKEEGQVISPIFELVRRDTGEIRLIVVKGGIARDNRGKFERTHCILMDITDQHYVEQKLKASVEKFRSIIEVSPVPMALNDEQLAITYLNPAFTQTYGYCVEDIPTLADWWLKAYPDPEYRNWVKTTWQARLKQAEREHQPFLPMELTICIKDGSVKTVVASAAIIARSFQNEHLVVLYDISDRKNNEIDLRIAATVFESQEGMLVTDANMNILRVNSAFTHITGYAAEDVIAKNPRILQSGRHDASFYAAMWESINSNGAWQGEVWNQRKNGEIYPENLTITAVKDQDSVISNYVATLTDITLSKEAVDKIERLAFYDPLTDLPNRRLLQDRLKPALASSHRSGRQGALLFIDMDNFKTLNDTLGHDMGDLLLQQVAQRLESCMREGDTVARLGGDEFVVMLEDLSEQAFEAATQTEMIGHKILAILNKPYQLATHEYRSTPSIGAALFNSQNQSSDELLKQADIAMYQAKASGRNALRFFDPQMQASITARVTLEEDLRLALKENQFILYYQPQVSHNRKIIGAEVLIRWQHPVRGLVSPAEFIPLAEETGLILAIGQWVMETACNQIKIWETSEHARHLQLAVNVSSRQFYQTDFVEQVHQILSQNTTNPNRLKLELTESLVLDDINDTILKMNDLRKIGVRFSMDDFGTGYSSLSSLKKLPLDQLKIDQCFVRDISVDQDDTIIVETIIAMANKLNIEVIAEGVETETQRVFLEEHDCQLFQGYLFSKPVPIEQFELLIKRNLL